MFRHSAVLLATLIAIAVPGQAEPPSPVHLVTDGKPWSISMADGPNGQLTLHPDGTGQMRTGLLKMKAIWRETADGGLCFESSGGAERCVILFQQGEALVGRRDGEEVFRLTRR